MTRKEERIQNQKNRFYEHHAGIINQTKENNNQKTIIMSQENIKTITVLNETQLSIAQTLSHLKGVDGSNDVIKKGINAINSIMDQVINLSSVSTDGKQTTIDFAPKTQKQELPKPIIKDVGKKKDNTPKQEVKEKVKSEVKEQPKEEIKEFDIVDANHEIMSLIASIKESKGSVGKEERKEIISKIKEIYPKDHEIQTTESVAHILINSMLKDLEDASSNDKEEITETKVENTSETKEEAKTSKEDLKNIIKKEEAEQQSETETTSEVTEEETVEEESSTDKLKRIFDEIKEVTSKFEDTPECKPILEKYTGEFENNHHFNQIKDFMIKSIQERRNHIIKTEGSTTKFGTNKVIKKFVAKTMAEMKQAS